MKGESLFRQRVQEFLKTLDNCVSESIQQVAIRGTFDIILCCQGWFVGAELKDERGLPDPLQTYKATKIRNQGQGIAFIWRPQNHQNIMQFLTQLNAGVFDKPLLTKINKEQNDI